MTEQWEELKETITELRDNDGTGTQQEVSKFLVNLMDVLEKKMSSSEKPGQWIPCSERLPAEGEKVLLCDRGGSMTLGRLVRTDEGYNWDVGTWWTDIEDGDAWMSLPEPYKGEKNETD